MQIKQRGKIINNTMVKTANFYNYYIRKKFLDIADKRPLRNLTIIEILRQWLTFKSAVFIGKT